MKKTFKLFISLLTAVACATLATAADTSVQNPAKQTLSAVKAAELPAKAAELVSQADASKREVSTAQIVQAALQIKPSATVSVVGAISRSVPEMAPTAAATAAEHLPDQAASFAKAAASAAPGQAAKIVEAICRRVPGSYRSVALAVAKVVPGKEKEIALAVAAALPELNAFITKVVAGADNTQTISLPYILDAAKPEKSSSPESKPVQLDLPPRGPTVGPPYIPLTTTPGNTTPGSSGEVPPGGRDYAAP